ncbi:MAG: response regulator [Nitrospiraceae bacterium]
MPKILVADDSITVRKVAERLLTEAGLEVALAASGEEALAWLANERPDFIVTDVIMPDKSGYDVCKYVKSHADLSDTPVLLISGIVNEDVTRKAESCRADGVLKKPFQGASLQDRVLELLAKRGDKASASPLQAADGEPAAELHGTSAQPPDAGSAPPMLEEVAEPEHASASAASPAPVGPSSQKAFRITEEQLQGFRQSANRIKELETQLVDEKARGDRMTEQVGAAKQTERRLHEVEAALADHEQRWADERQRGQANDELENRDRGLSSTLAEQAQRISDLTSQLNQFAELEKRNKDLESSVEDLQTRLSRAEQESSTPKENGDGVPQLQLMIADQQQRLSDLAHQVIRFGEAETKVKALEASLANEQSRANDMVQRCGDLERAAARATMKLEDMTKLLAQIASLASKAEENPENVSS